MCWGQDEVSGRGRDFRMRPVSTSHALTVLTPQGQGLWRTSSHHQQRRGLTLGGHGRKATAPCEGRNAGEGLGAQTETQGSFAAVWADEGAPGSGQGGEAFGPAGLGAQLPWVSGRALVSSALSPLEGPWPFRPPFTPSHRVGPVFRRELARPPERPRLPVRGHCSPGASPRASASPLQPCSPRKLSSLSLTPQSSAELSFSCLLPPRLLLTLL